MVRRSQHSEGAKEKTLTPLKDHCELCNQLLWVANHNHRTITTLSGVWKLTLVIRQCVQPKCPNYHRRQRPEGEGFWALPHGEFGLDVIACIGMLHSHNYSSSEIHQNLLSYGINISRCNVTYLMGRYKELLQSPHERVKIKLQQQEHVLLAIHRIQFQDTLWIVRDCLSTDILLMRRYRRDKEDWKDDLKDNVTSLLIEVKYFLKKLEVSVEGVIFCDEEKALIRSVVTEVFPHLNS